MIEKIEITQRFNFKRLNRHYECFTIDFLNGNAYYKISERGSGDKFLSENPLCDDTWTHILADLRRKMTSRIYRPGLEKMGRLMHEYESLGLFDDFESEKFKYFEKIELVYSCNVIVYSTDGYGEYSFKNNFPEKWEAFGDILKECFGFDVLHLNYQAQLATPLFHEILPDGVYINGERLLLKSIEFGHYRTYPYDIPHPRLIVNMEKGAVEGYIEKNLTLNDEKLILDLLHDYHVYMWIFDDYHRKSHERDPDDLEGYDWYLEMVFEGDVIWHIFGYNDYPDTYVHLARRILEITGMDLCEVATISDGDLILFEKFGDEILSK